MSPNFSVTYLPDCSAPKKRTIAHCDSLVRDREQLPGSEEVLAMYVNVSPSSQEKVNVSGMMFELLNECESTTREGKALDLVPTALELPELALSFETKLMKSLGECKVAYGHGTILRRLWNLGERDEERLLGRVGVVGF